MDNLYDDFFSNKNKLYMNDSNMDEFDNNLLLDTKKSNKRASTFKNQSFSNQTLETPPGLRLNDKDIDDDMDELDISVQLPPTPKFFSTKKGSQIAKQNISDMSIPETPSFKTPNLKVAHPSEYSNNDQDFSSPSLGLNMPETPKTSLKMKHQDDDSNLSDMNEEILTGIINTEIIKSNIKNIRDISHLDEGKDESPLFINSIINNNFSVNCTPMRSTNDHHMFDEPTPMVDCTPLYTLNHQNNSKFAKLNDSVNKKQGKNKSILGNHKIKINNKNTSNQRKSVSKNSIDGNSFNKENDSPNNQIIFSNNKKGREVIQDYSPILNNGESPSFNQDNISPIEKMSDSPAIYNENSFYSPNSVIPQTMPQDDQQKISEEESLRSIINQQNLSNGSNSGSFQQEEDISTDPNVSLQNHNEDNDNQCEDEQVQGEGDQEEEQEQEVYRNIEMEEEEQEVDRHIEMEEKLNENICEQEDKEDTVKLATNVLLQSPTETNNEVSNDSSVIVQLDKSTSSEVEVNKEINSPSLHKQQSFHTSFYNSPSTKSIREEIFHHSFSHTDDPRNLQPLSEVNKQTQYLQSGKLNEEMSEILVDFSQCGSSPNDVVVESGSVSLNEESISESFGDDNGSFSEETQKINFTYKKEESSLETSITNNSSPNFTNEQSNDSLDSSSVESDNFTRVIPKNIKPSPLILSSQSDHLSQLTDLYNLFFKKYLESLKGSKEDYITFSAITDLIDIDPTVILDHIKSLENCRLLKLVVTSQNQLSWKVTI